MTIRFKSESVQQHRELADKIIANAKVEGADISEEVPHLSYNENLPEGHTPEGVKVLSKYNNNYIQGCRVATAELSTGVFKKNKDIDTVQANFGFFAPGDNLNVVAERSHDYANPRAKDGQPTTVTKHMVLTTKVTHRGQSGKTLREAISTEYTNTFAK